MRLVVFFSRGMSLDGWRRAGILDREMALYGRLLPHLHHLAFVTYGGPADVDIARQFPGLEVLTNRWNLPSNLYSVAAPFLHWRALDAATVFKTNQINGAWAAVIAKRRYRKALLVRCGFLWSDFVARLHPDSWRQRAAVRLERTAFQAADAAIVAAAADRETILTRYNLSARRVHVIPNYVDTALFAPQQGIERRQGQVLFIGRLEDQKNVDSLIDAVDGLPGVTLAIVGDGLHRARLQDIVAQRRLGVTFMGAQPHGELPRLLGECSVFVLPSFYEGNPKSLVEAMACGVPVVGTRVPGIREIIVHGENGYLCGTSAGEIREALQAVLSDADLRARMADRAVAYVRENCSLTHAVDRELAVLRSAVDDVGVR